MTITQIEYAIAIYTHRNFSIAAEKCFVTQPTLSAQIQKLEDELGIFIFDRSKHPITVTDEGEAFISQAYEVIHSYKKLYEVVKTVKNEMSGTLKLGVIPSVSPYLIPLFINHLATTLPLVNIIIEELSTKQIVKKIKTDQIDIGLLVSPLLESSIIETPLFQEPFLCYIHPEHPLFNKETINTSDLDIDEMALMEEGNPLRNQILRSLGFSTNNIEYNKEKQVVFNVGSIEMVIQMVEIQKNYTLLPALCISSLKEEQKKWLRKLENENPYREICLATHQSFAKQRLLFLLKNTILQSLPSNLFFV
ncbi:MAG: LysR family transcriptional regulator [Saprospiraceae bacterium]|nr:LysR family transcriptional regulator [Saprospiraceae bacterium]